MAQILIVEDDEFLREILCDYLTEKGHKIQAVPNGKVARDIVLNGNFDLVVSDVQMPFLNGVELLQWIRERSQIPFIMMTGFTNLLETQKAADLGAQGFLSKPFSNQDLLQLITNVLQPAPALTEQEKQVVEQNYCKVSIEEFVARPKVEFDIFIRLQSARFLKVAYQGESLDISRLKNYQNRGVTHLYIQKDDFGKLVAFNLQVAKVLQKTGSVDAEKKVRFIRYTAESVMERCHIDGVNKESFNEAKEFVNLALDAITSNPDMLDLLTIMQEHSDALYAHGLAVSVYSVMIAKRLEYTSSQTLFKLAMAGLLHDIGKKELDRQLLEKPRPLMSVQERRLYESHVQRGREILAALPGTPADVIQIVFEHHEDEIEQGYPCQTSHMKLHPLSRIVYLADHFVTRVQRGQDGGALNAWSALVQIEQFDIEHLNKRLFEALKGLVIGKKAA
jgi:putative nucleotidyltransferase with HDIG domain